MCVCHRSVTEGSLDSPDFLHLLPLLGKNEAMLPKGFSRNIAAYALHVMISVSSMDGTLFDLDGDAIPSYVSHARYVPGARQSARLLHV